MNSARQIGMVLAFWTLAGASGAARGQVVGQQDGITVVGTGAVQAKPNAVEIIGTVTGEAQLANDALVKYRDNKRRAMEGIANLKIEGVSVEGSGFAINSGGGPSNLNGVVFAGQPQPTITPKVTVTEPLTITIKGADQIEEEELVKRIIRLIDAGKDSGLAIGTSSMDARTRIIQAQMGMATNDGLAAFKLVGAEEARKKAYEEAMKNARTSAERLASLAGVKLGKVVSVTEQPNAQAARQMVVVYNFGGESDTAEPSYRSTTFKKIPVTVTLSVRFAIE